MKNLNVCLFTIALALLAPISTIGWAQPAVLAPADVPHLISYQGMLQSPTGAPVDGPQAITVRLYADAGGKELVWEDTYSTNVVRGVFNLSLGSQKPLPAASTFGVPLWVAVKVGESDELRPMTQLTTSPYALNVANGSITMAKMGTDFVGSISVNGQRVGGRGSDVNFVAGSGLAMTFDMASNAILLSGNSGSSMNGKDARVQNSNPMDALGDMIYGGNGGTETALSGNTTTTRKFLNQTGTGSASAVPAWGAIAASDINGLLAGTSNEITITTSGGVITYATPQAIATSSSPTFSTLTLSGKATSTATASTDGSTTLTTKGYVDAGNATNAAAISSETSARSSGDNTLTTNLNSEIANRQGAVTSEASARTAADATLTTNLNNEIANRQAVVTSEANSRISAVSGLTTSLNGEIALRQAAVASEANTRASADNTLTGSLQSEVTRATTEEGSLQTQINGLTMPQDLSTTASPTFAGLTLTGSPLINYGNLYQVTPSFFYSDISLYGNASIGGNIEMNYQSILDVADPFFAQDAANKNYVDGLIGQVNSTLSTDVSQINTTLASVNTISVDYSGSGSGTYSGHSVSITGSTANVVNLIGYNASASGSDDQNIGIKATGQGSGGGSSIGGDFTGHNTSGSGYAIGGRFAATGASNNIAVQATSGSIQVQSAGEGIILKSPNGTCYKLTVNNDGTLSTSAITCP